MYCVGGTILDCCVLVRFGLGCIGLHRIELNWILPGRVGVEPSELGSSLIGRF